MNRGQSVIYLTENTCSGLEQLTSLETLERTLNIPSKLVRAREKILSLLIGQYWHSSLVHVPLLNPCEVKRWI